MSTQSISRTQQSLDNMIEHAKDWDEKISILCAYHNLPDLRTRRGLKQIHKAFEQVTKQLDATYDDPSTSEEVQTALVVLFGLICQDYVLEDKLVANGFLKKMVSFVQREDVRDLALSILLRMIIHHGPPRWEIIRTLYTPLSSLLRIALNEGDITAIRSLVHVFSEGGAPALCFNEMYAGTDYIEVNLREIVTFHTAALYRLGPSHHELLIDFNKLVYVAVSEAPAFSIPVILGEPSALNLLVAGLSRSAEMFDRIQSFLIFNHLHMQGKEPALGLFNVPHAFEVLSNDVGLEDRARLMEYGVPLLETCRALSAREEFMNALSTLCEDSDMLKCGWRIFDSIMAHPLGPCSAPVPTSANVPFKDWLDILLPCADAIRVAGPSVRKNLDAADIIELRYHHEKKNKNIAADISRRGIERSPTQGFFYSMAAFMSDDPKDVLPLAERGLHMSTDDSTSWHVLLALHQVAAEAAIQLALIAAGGLMTENEDFSLHDVVELLLKVVEHSRPYRRMASPDDRGLKEMIAYEILALLTLRKGDDGESLGKEVEHLLEEHRAAERLTNLLHSNPDLSFVERAFKTFLENYKAGYSEWNDILTECRFVASVDAYPASGTPGSTVYILTSLPKHAPPREIWDRDEQSDDLESPKVPPQTLFRCAHCHNPSAALRKCSRCLRVAYCSAECQQKHWKAGGGKGHKEKCVRVSSSTS